MKYCPELLFSDRLVSWRVCTVFASTRCRRIVRCSAGTSVKSSSDSLRETVVCTAINRSSFDR